jgi:hypothetical protein
LKDFSKADFHADTQTQLIKFKTLFLFNFNELTKKEAIPVSYLIGGCVFFKKEIRKNTHARRVEETI